MPPLLQVRDLTITAAGTPLHTHLSLTLSAGDLVAVTGPSGTGKTTLLRTICGLQDPDAGTILLEARDADAWGWPEFRRKVLLVSQKPILLNMTVEENLRRPFTYHAATSPFPEQTARHLLDELEVGADRLDQTAQTLSVGQQQRVSLIRALLLEPLVLCLDEPTSALDPDSSERVQHLISRLAAERGLAALIVTHSPQQAETWCSRRIELPAKPQARGGA
ncbi:MAG: ABC transporter ATP-binding protein [Janthinobacterium lividum]